MKTSALRRINMIVREEAGDNPDGGGAGESDFIKLTKERSRGEQQQNPDTPSAGNPDNAAPKPDEFAPLPIPGSNPMEKPKDLLTRKDIVAGTDAPPEGDKGKSPDANGDDSKSLADMLLGALSPTKKQEKREEKRSDADDSAELLRELVGDLPEPPPAGSPTGQHFDHLKAISSKMREKLLELGRESKELKKGTVSIEDKARLADLAKEKAALEEALAQQKLESDRVKRRLAAFDLREDPEFSRMYVEPVAKKEGELLELISYLEPEASKVVRSEIAKAMSISSEAEFRRAINSVTEQLEGPDAVDIRREAFALRRLHVEQIRAQNDIDNTSVNVQRSREERGRMSAKTFIDRDVREAQEAIAEQDPMVRMLETDGVRAVLSKHIGAIDAADRRIDESVMTEATRSGSVSKDLASVVALAKIRMRERVVYATVLSDHAELKRQHAELQEQYRRATGKHFTGTSEPDKSGGKAESHEGGLVGFAKATGRI